MQWLVNTEMNERLAPGAALLLLVISTGSNSQDITQSMQIDEADKPYLLTYPNLNDPNGRVVFSNEHVVLQRLVVPAGEWEGVHSHPGNQLYVHINGGEWSGRLGGEIEYWASLDEDGAVGWMDEIPISAGHDSGNTGDAPIDLIYVTLKSDSPIAPNGAHAPQAFPAISPELLFENDRMIAQRIDLEPGEWTGRHGHQGNQVIVHVSGGHWSERRDSESAPSRSQLAAGSVEWIEAGREHDVGNTGDDAMHLVLVTLK